MKEGDRDENWNWPMMETNLHEGGQRKSVKRSVDGATITFRRWILKGF